MIETKDNNPSLWQSLPQTHFSTLKHSTLCDVCIIGAGVSGLSVGYFLAKKGLKVVIIDDGEIGGRQTFRSTGHLSNAYDDRYFEIERLHGLPTSQIVASSHSAAISKIQEIIKEERISCDFQTVNGYLFLAPQHEIDYLKKEEQAAKEAGINAKLYSYIPELGSQLGPSLCFPEQAMLHPGKYMIGLAKAIQQYGGEIYHHTRAIEIKSGPSTYVLTKDHHRIIAKNIVVATNVPINTLLQIHLKQTAYRSYVVCFEIPQNDFPNILLWNTDDPYKYVRKYTARGIDYLIVGGEDHKTGHDIDHDPYKALENWARSKFSYLGKVVHHWSGQVIETVDNLAYIGELEKNVYIASGDSGNGLTYGSIAGMLISDLIFGHKNEWKETYNPHRISLKSTNEFLKENLDMAIQYKDWATSGEVTTEDQINPNEGAVIRDGLLKVAAYRDEHGELHKLSAVCTHLGGIVHWNSDEKTWDCPCHGSRFSMSGEVINGPAVQDLKPIESTEGEKSPYQEITPPEIPFLERPTLTFKG